MACDKDKVGDKTLDGCCCRSSYLHIASQLSGGIKTSLGVLAEPEAGLGSEADSVSVAVVDAA